jgi:hypothetical protein
MKSTWSLIIFAAAVILLLILISGKRAVYVPADAQHAGLTSNAACLECHAPGKPAPLRKDHPPKEECLTCHKYKKRG